MLGSESKKKRFISTHGQLIQRRPSKIGLPLERRTGSKYSGHRGLPRNTRNMSNQYQAKLSSRKSVVSAERVFLGFQTCTPDSGVYSGSKATLFLPGQQASIITSINTIVIFTVFIEHYLSLFSYLTVPPPDDPAGRCVSVFLQFKFTCPWFDVLRLVKLWISMSSFTTYRRPELRVHRFTTTLHPPTIIFRDIWNWTSSTDARDMIIHPALLSSQSVYFGTGENQYKQTMSSPRNVAADSDYETFH